jgi:hypothetical protein
LQPRWLHKFEIKPGQWVFVPNQESRLAGQKIKQEIESVWHAPAYYAHLRKGGHVAALRGHLKDKLFLSADISHFFNCINRSRITRNLKNLLSYNRARKISNESTVKNPLNPTEYVLPYGFIQSSVIASLCFYKSAVGRYLHVIRKRGCNVTVYMDDILISTNLSADDAQKIFCELKEKAEKSRFPLNYGKTTAPDLKAEMFNITVDSSGLKIVKERMRQFETKILAATKNHEIMGVLRYVKQIDSGQYESLSELTSDKR